MRLTTIAHLLLASDGLSAPSRIDAALAKGEKALAAAREAEGTGLLRAFEAAKPHFRRARALAARALEGAPGDAALARAREGATRRLVAILNAETVIYLDRGNLSLAGKRNAEALALLPDDLRAKALEGEVKDPEPEEIDATLVRRILRGDDGFLRAGSLAAHLRSRRGAEQRLLERRGARVR